MRFDWTPERVEQLKALWSSTDKPSCSEIAVILGGRSLSRNAVMGKVHRLDLESRGINGNYKGNGRAKSHRPRVFKPRAPSHKPTRYALSFNAATVTKIPIEPFEVRLAAVTPLHLGLMQLTDATCRYPYGDGPITFCGCDVREGKPYCSAHYELSNETPERAREKRSGAMKEAWKRRREMVPA